MYRGEVFYKNRTRTNIIQVQCLASIKEAFRNNSSAVAIKVTMTDSGFWRNKRAARDRFDKTIGLKDVTSKEVFEWSLEVADKHLPSHTNLSSIAREEYRRGIVTFTPGMSNTVAHRLLAPFRHLQENVPSLTFFWKYKDQDLFGAWLGSMFIREREYSWGEERSGMYNLYRYAGYHQSIFSGICLDAPQTPYTMRKVWALNPYLSTLLPVQPIRHGYALPDYSSGHGTILGPSLTSAIMRENDTNVHDNAEGIMRAAKAYYNRSTMAGHMLKALQESEKAA